MVRAAAVNPNLKILADYGGQVLSLATGFHYRTGLSRAALFISAFVPKGGKLKIENGSVFRQQTDKTWHQIHTNKRLFGSIEHEFELTEEAATPEAIASHLRWEVFYDKGKVKFFAKVAFAATAINISLNGVLSYIFNKKAAETGSTHLTDYYYGLIETKNTIISWYPDFHDLLTDPSKISFSNSHPLSVIFMHLWVSGLIFLGLSHFHNDKTLISPDRSSQRWGKISNVALGLYAAATTTVISFDLALHGAWDYFLVFQQQILPIGPFNTTDLMTVGIFPLAMWSICKKLLCGLTENPAKNPYKFPTDLSPDN